ncbi:phage terminase small subunit P27 family [Oceanobacillus profundus]|uniref:phage terminase small subunit P27 family n=1 Tax=Oceanobacillus TaxID=182709 RepID=UPI0026E41B04|nr:phage terminase small subunit P27 family [Oceanobacillus profundus]MDO6448095.1 phage terminase small subunit P27 family [Oceanobacillus profundus]
MTKDMFRVPSWLDNMAKTEWKRVREIIDLSSFTEMDLKALEAYCQAYAKWKRCEMTLMKEGYTFETPKGYVQQRPEVSISNNALSDMHSIAKELGFTPASRIRMDKNKGEGSGGSGGGAKNGNRTDPEMENMIS